MESSGWVSLSGRPDVTFYHPIGLTCLWPWNAVLPPKKNDTKSSSKEVQKWGTKINCANFILLTLQHFIVIFLCYLPFPRLLVCLSFFCLSYFSPHHSPLPQQKSELHFKPMEDDEEAQIELGDFLAILHNFLVPPCGSQMVQKHLQTEYSPFWVNSAQFTIFKKNGLNSDLRRVFCNKKHHVSIEVKVRSPCCVFSSFLLWFYSHNPDRSDLKEFQLKMYQSFKKKKNTLKTTTKSTTIFLQNSLQDTSIWLIHQENQTKKVDPQSRISVSSTDQ